MRALLYACTTAADLGRTVLDEKLPELRRLVALRGWEVGEEFADSIPTGVGKRPGFAALCAAVEAGKGDVVVANSIADICWDLAAGLKRLQELGVGSRVSLVCVRNSFDSTTPSGALRLLDALALVAEHRRDRARDRQQIGILRQHSKEHGLTMAGRPRVVLSLMEVKEMFEGGLSQPEMLRKLAAVGAEVSKGTLSKAILNGLEAGSLDQQARAAAIEKRGGLNRGGPTRRAGTLDVQAFAPKWEAGLPVKEIARQLTTEGKPVSRHWLTKLIRKALDAGHLDAEARARALPEAREKSRRRQKAAA